MTKFPCRGAIAGVLLPALVPPAWSAGVPTRTLEEVEITAERLHELVGEPSSASEGVVLAEQLENRPILRTAEILEVVPGLIITQHSGDGKANQFFLRGFNLDHGTDFASRVDGVPVNMPTHAHGQGYSDLNFMIPELVDRVAYRKGPYYADEGNFSAAGAVDIGYGRRLAEPLLLLTAGEHTYGRALLAASPQLAGGDLLLAAETTYSDGPWDLQSHFRKLNGVMKFTRGGTERGFSLAAMGYEGRWQATDQIPLRAVESGEIGRFGFVNPSNGGETHRYSLAASGWRNLGPGELTGLVYGIDYELDLYSDFTYQLNEIEGDQFEQYDARRIGGGDVRYTLPLALFGRPGELAAGLQLRYDDISPVGLHLTEQRERYETVRQDEVQQSSFSAYLSQDTRWTQWLRSEIGVRFDEYHFAVQSSLAENSGSARDDIASPKASLVFGPWAKTEYFVNWGKGFHSNDARGSTIRVDPADGLTPVDAVTPLVPATGMELGVRTAIVPRVQIAASLWRLDLASELIFVGDGGATEASRASRRSGVELAVYYQPIDHVILDADVAFTRAHLLGDDPAGDRIPNAVERVVSIGATYHHERGFFGGARLRYLGEAPLIEDGSVRSVPTTLLNLKAGYHFTQNLSASVMLLNALDERENDITYFYESRLPQEPAPVDDIHFHPAEPRQLRLVLEAKF